MIRFPSGAGDEAHPLGGSQEGGSENGLVERQRTLSTDAVSESALLPAAVLVDDSEIITDRAAAVKRAKVPRPPPRNSAPTTCAAAPTEPDIQLHPVPFAAAPSL
jgi:hypothetical protein